MKADFRFGPPKAWANNNILAKIAKHCEEVGECLEWQGSFNAAGPQARFGPTVMGVRKAYMMAIGKHREGAIYGCSCGNRHCVKGEHIVRRDRHQHALHASKRAATPARSAKIAATKQRLYGKLTPVQVMEMRQSDKSSRWWAKELGINQTTANRAISGRSYKQVGGNFFAGLMK